jgi:hypothetical protein
MDRRAHRHADRDHREYVVRVVVSGVEDARVAKEVAIAVQDENRIAASTMAATN